MQPWGEEKIMSEYVDLDDPEVTYSHNAGLHEVYIIGSEAERIDLVRCGECKYREMFTPSWSYCPHLEWTVTDSFFCGDGERREE